MKDTIALIEKSFPTLLRGTFVTMKLTVLIVAMSLVLGLIVAFCHTYGGRSLRACAAVYDRIFRSIPELVLLLLVFYGLPGAGIRLNPFYASVLALGLRSTAYMAQIYRGSFMAVGSDQLTAASSLGMSEYKAFAYVIFPQAIRTFIPPFANEYAIILKDTSLAYAIGVVELLRQGQYIIAVEYKPLPIFLVIAAIYFVLTFGVTRLLKKLEEKLKLPGIGA